MSSDHSLFNVVSAPFNKVIKVPSSKSYANRLLVLAAIKHEDVLVENLPPSTDVTIMINCLEEIGISIERCNEGVWVRGSFPECEGNKSLLLKTGNGGTTNRFLCALLARGSQKYILAPEGHMLKRPMEPLLEALESLGVKTSFEDEDQWITIQGPFNENKTVDVDATETTQFLTGLALATADLSIEVNPKGLSVSKPYWLLTENLISCFKNGEINFFNPIDFSSLTYPLALAAVTGEVTVVNCLKRDFFQADSAFIEVLEIAGAKVEWLSEGLRVSRSELKAFEFDGSQCPDAVPTILFLCSFCEGKSVITSLEVLTHKECDRFLEMIRMLKAFGVEINVDYDKFSIDVIGKSYSIKSVSYDPPADHRMVMVAYLFQRAISGGNLTNSHHVAKSFANYFEAMS
jgi:3-phosphoshikimate 1-carboxyvinyltransferase